MDRGIRASVAGMEEAKQALKSKAWTQGYLAGASGCTRQTVNRFLAGKEVDKWIFQAICTELGLEQEVISQYDSTSSSNKTPSLDEFVEILRINTYDNIYAKCGVMKVLEMTQPLDLNAIYTTVNILEGITGHRRLEYQSFTLENFERFGLGYIKEARVPALDAVEKYSKLMILGKPGSGKTTFLKYVALQCIEGTFKPKLVPVFITLRDFAKDQEHPDLLKYLYSFYQAHDITPESRVRNSLLDSILHKEVEPIKSLLEQGRFLLLLDGLDEVREVDSQKVLKSIEDFSVRFPKNLFVVTCRIAAREYTFERFVDVEVADFDDRQITTFVNQWFKARNDPAKASMFFLKSEQDKGVRDLASSPLLLTLLCSVFESSGCFPLNKAELYKDGVEVLLKKWDSQRDIERGWVYQGLPLKRKEDLLSQVALEKFQQGNYFFRQRDIENDITKYICNLSGASNDEEILRLDSEAILKSIEAQHGLLVERAKGIYSFSHLTFHEYFAARKIVTAANSDSLMHDLVEKITEKRWREIFLLTVGMLDDSGILVCLMKQKIDSILGSDDHLQAFLIWMEQKFCSIRIRYESASIKVNYFALIMALPLALDPSLDAVTAKIHASDLALDIDSNLDPSLARDIALARLLCLSRVIDFALSRILTGDLIIARIFDLDLSRDLDPVVSRDLLLVSELTAEISRCLDLASKIASPELYRALQEIKNQLPDLSQKGHKKFYLWWKSNGKHWIEQLRSVLLEHRNISHNWRFNERQKQLLRQYRDANLLLVDCLNSDCYISRKIREEIKDTLLLPLEHI